MFTKLYAKWLGVLIIAALTLLVTPVTAQTTPGATPETASTLPLAAPGPYTVGVRSIQLIDTTRDRTLTVDIWYPALAPAKPTAKQKQLITYIRGWFEAEPDLQAAPYPLVLYSPWFTGSILADEETRLASQGYVVAGPAGHPNENMQDTFVDRPLDMLFVLDQLTALNQTDFSGEIDTDHVGILGTSLGAYTTLALTGARFDPTSASQWGTPSPTLYDINPLSIWGDWNWDNLVAYRSSLTSLAPLNDDDFWPAFTDPRIQAAVMWSPCDTPLFGERGLAAATVPSLIIGSNNDDTCPYQPDSVYPFDHLGSQDRYLLTIVNGGHVPGVGEPVITQLYTAFFDDYLKGQKDNAQYLTADYLDSIQPLTKLKLAWGDYTGS